MIATPPSVTAETIDPITQLRTVFSRLCEASADDSAIVVMGEPGTGKSLLAAITHCCSPRAAAPFVAVSCALRPEPTLEDQLFGKAGSARPGALQAAEGGTLLLADIDLAPPRIQQRLATALREHRAGSPSVQTDRAVRPVATTTRELRRLAAAGRFSSELLSQLEGLAIDVPIQLLCSDRLFTRAGASAAPPARPSLDDRLREIEAEIIGSALRASGGNKSRAASALHIKRTTLTDRIQRLGERLLPWARMRGAGEAGEPGPPPAAVRPDDSSARAEER
jgi:DNA-binding NtrC family response regulator